jgi:hypothetical protein
MVCEDVSFIIHYFGWQAEGVFGPAVRNARFQEALANLLSGKGCYRQLPVNTSDLWGGIRGVLVSGTCPE